MATKCRPIVLLTLTLALVVGPFTIGVDGNVTEEEEQQIDEFIEEFLQCMGIPGLNLAAVRYGEVALTKGYGKADLDLDIDVTSKTVFNIASTSKAFTSVLLAQILSEHEEFDWDSPVRDMIGDWFHFSDGYRSNGTTLRDLLAHKMGVYRHDTMAAMDQWSSQEQVERIRFFEPIEPYRTTFMYNNIMYAVAGHVAEVLSGGGATLEELMETRIFEELGMEDSTFIHLAGPDYEGFAIPYYGVRQGPKTPMPWDIFNGVRSTPGAGAISSTADDMALWLNFLLGNTGTGSLNPEVVAETFRAEAVTWIEGFSKPQYEETIDLIGVYARGWFDGHYRGYQAISHGGDYHGFHSHVVLLPDMGIALYSSMNFPDNSGIERTWLHAFILDILLGEEPWFDAQYVCDILPDKVHQSQLSAWNYEAQPIITKSRPDEIPRDLESRLPLSAYVGVYGNFGYGNITIYLDETDTILQMQYGNNGWYNLFPTPAEDVFRAVGNRSPADILEIGTVHFSSSTGDEDMDSMMIPAFSVPDRQMFTRDLALADAPPPSLEGCAP